MGSEYKALENMLYVQTKSDGPVQPRFGKAEISSVSVAVSALPQSRREGWFDSTTYDQKENLLKIWTKKKHCNNW